MLPLKAHKCLGDGRTSHFYTLLTPPSCTSILQPSSTPNLFARSLLTSCIDSMLTKSSIALLTLGVLVLRFFVRRYVSPISHLPGPFLASGTRLWKFFTVLKGHNELEKVALHKKYGPIVRIGPNEVAFGSPSAATDILSTKKAFHKTDFYTCFPIPDNPDIFTTIDEAKHAMLKRHAAVPYSLSSMNKMAKYIDEVADFLMEKLDRFADGRQTVDLTDWLQWFSFDVSILN